MRHFEPTRVNLGFALFASLFTFPLLTSYKWVSLLVVFAFSAVFAYACYLYFEDPTRGAETEEFVRRWRERLDERWRRFPPLVRNVEYYLRSTPEGGLVGTSVVILLSILLMGLLAYLL